MNMKINRGHSLINLRFISLADNGLRIEDSLANTIVINRLINTIL
jgi:hypothetical protein